jgi:hypothetical protein
MSSANKNSTKRKRETYDEQTQRLGEEARNRAAIRRGTIKPKKNNNKGSMPSLPLLAVAASCTGIGCAVSGGNRRTRRNKRRKSKSRRR